MHNSNAQLFSEKVSRIDFEQIKIDRSKDLRIRFSKLSKELVSKIIEATKTTKSDIIGIVYFTNFIDVTFKTRQSAIDFKSKLESRGDSFPEVTNFFLLQSEDIPVYLRNVPIMLSNDIIKSYFSQYHGEAKSIVWRKDDSGYWSGERAVYVKKEVLHKYPMKSYIYIGGCEIFVKYRNQVLTCRTCGREGHTQKQCFNQRSRGNQESANNNYSLNQNDYPRLGKSNTIQNTSNGIKNKIALKQSQLNLNGLSNDEMATVNALKDAITNFEKDPLAENITEVSETNNDDGNGQLHVNNQQPTAPFSPVPSNRTTSNMQLTPFKLTSTTGTLSYASGEQGINLDEESPTNQSKNLKRSFVSSSSTEEMDRNRLPPTDLTNQMMDNNTSSDLNKSDDYQSNE